MDSKPLPEKKKRGRKSKKELEMMKNLHLEKQEEDNEIKQPKKRGRKPRGGKIFPKINTNNSLINEKNNIILHLKCSMSDIDNKIYDENIEHFQFNETKIGDLNYEVINKKQNISYSTNYNRDNNVDSNNDKNTSDNSKSIHEKIEALSYNLYTNNVCDKKSACFWCTYDFDNTPIYIPKYELNNSYNVYGCFCSPECATAHLMKENISSSAKFERYHLLNHIYCKIYDYKKNINPAPNPYYILNKYYGNLTIQEYRKLLKNERLLLIVDKPLTRILPELHQDNDDFLINSNSIPASKYNVMKKRKKESKASILSKNFGM